MFNSVSRVFPVHHRLLFRISFSVFFALAWLSCNTAQAQATTYALGTASLLVGPAAGSNSVVLAVTPATGGWTNTANATWLHLSAANQNGAGSTNIVFSYDANGGATRSGALTIANQTLTVLQAGLTYVSAGSLTTLVSSGLAFPQSLAVDGAGNVYIADTDNNAIKEWSPSNNSVTTLVSSNLDSPYAVAVDGGGNIYIADFYDQAIKEWMPSTSNLTTLSSSIEPQGVAVDGAGNVYFSDAGDEALKEWTRANSNVTILSSVGNEPSGLSIDVAGNVYVAGFGTSKITEWRAANSKLTTLGPLSVLFLQDVAVDGSGNVYFTTETSIDKWTAANGNTTLFSAGPVYPNGVVVDGAGNVYMAGYSDIAGYSAITEIPHAFVDPTPKSENLGAGTDALPLVLPATVNLLPPFAPTSDQAWLTIAGITNGIVSFSFAANTGLSRTAHITLLGQSIPITQAGVTPPSLTGLQMVGNGVIQFAFTNNPAGSFTVLSSTNLSLPLTNWMVAGSATNTGSGQFQFTSQPTTNDSQRFYIVVSP
jgi:sugar lactone lactonase YvrE